MPFTPFHFGPGAALKVVCPRYFSFSTFCAAQVLTDLEPGYYLWRHDYPVHRWAHTYVGAVPIAIAAAVVVAVLYQPLYGMLKRRLGPFAGWIGDRRPTWWVGLLSGLAGTTSHVFLDSLMHRDATPFAPFSPANPLLGVVGHQTIQLCCLLLGVVAAICATLREKP